MKEMSEDRGQQRGRVKDCFMISWQNMYFQLQSWLKWPVFFFQVAVVFHWFRRLLWLYFATSLVISSNLLHHHLCSPLCHQITSQRPFLPFSASSYSCNDPVDASRLCALSGSFSLCISLLVLFISSFVLYTILYFLSRCFPFNDSALFYLFLVPLYTFPSCFSLSLSLSPSLSLTLSLAVPFLDASFCPTFCLLTDACFCFFHLFCQQFWTIFLHLPDCFTWIRSLYAGIQEANLPVGDVRFHNLSGWLLVQGYYNL